MERAAALAFADQLRNAREAALNDAEAFDGIHHAIERLGSFLTQNIGDLGKYKDEIEKIASTSAMAEEVPKCFRGVLTPFLVIYLLTGKVVTAAAFMIVSNIYTTVAYFLHERVWAGIIDTGRRRSLGDATRRAWLSRRLSKPRSCTARWQQVFGG